MRYHQMPPDLFAALADGGGTEAMPALVAAQHSKHALLLHGVTRAAAAAGHPQAGLAARGLELLDEVRRNDAKAAATVIGHPSVGAWAYRTLTGLRRAARGDVARGAGGGAAMPGSLAGIAAAAALHAGAAVQIEVPVADGVVMLPTLGAVGGVEDRTATVRVSAEGGAEVTGGITPVRVPAAFRSAAPGWRPLRPLLTVPGFELVADDVDPFRMPAASHVARHARLDGWPETFRAAWELLTRHHPEVAAQMAAIIRVVVPLRRPAQGQASSSSPETFGAIAMSDPVDPVTLAVTIAHELQHVKLSALLDLVPLTKPDDGARFYAPWRDDPRPASGLLQGTYAYLGVTAFWRRMLADRAAGTVPTIDKEFEFFRWRSAAASAARTLLHSGRLTRAGEQFVSAMAATLAQRAPEPVNERARARAIAANARHLMTWQSAHGCG